MKISITKKRSDYSKEISDQVLSNLCYYNPLNPNSDWNDKNENVPLHNDCKCDNCFYGRTALAERCLSLLDQIDLKENSIRSIRDVYIKRIEEERLKNAKNRNRRQAAYDRLRKEINELKRNP